MSNIRKGSDRNQSLSDCTRCKSGLCCLWQWDIHPIFIERVKREQIPQLAVYAGHKQEFWLRICCCTHFREHKQRTFHIAPTRAGNVLGNKKNSFFSRLIVVTVNLIRSFLRTVQEERKYPRTTVEFFYDPFRIFFRVKVIFVII